MILTSGTAIVATAALCGSCTAIFALRANERAVLQFAPVGAPTNPSR